VAASPRPYRFVRLAAGVLWQPLFASSRGGAPLAFLSPRDVTPGYSALQHGLTLTRARMIVEMRPKSLAMQHTLPNESQNGEDSLSA
jgi:hypothetical protein